MGKILILEFFFKNLVIILNKVDLILIKELFFLLLVMGKRESLMFKF